MDNLPANLRFLSVLIAAIVFFLSTKVSAGVQDDFFWAIDKDNLSQVSELIKKGANPDVLNAEGYTSLMVAAKTGNLKLAQFLIDAGAKLNIRNRLGETAIMLASYQGSGD